MRGARRLLLLFVAVAHAVHPTSPDCIERNSFVFLDFDNGASDTSSCDGILEHSNLGGLGGKCTMVGQEGLCRSGAPNASTPHEILMRDIGYLGLATIGDRLSESIDLRITNESEYRGYNPEINGIKASATTSQTGCFGVINLLAPRSTRRVWSTIFTFVQIRLEFLSTATGATVTLPRTYMTFCALLRHATRLCSTPRHAAPCVATPRSLDSRGQPAVIESRLCR